jgi:Cys-rich protein (TIGR01571 family)
MTEPIAIAVPVQESTLQVVAPSNMEGGYEFFVNAGNHMAYKVRVPDGGVVVGQQFDAIIVSEATASNISPSSSSALHNIPSGRWRDGLCDCCIHGCCHAVCCMGLWCTPCALGQVLHRMRFNVCACPWQNDENPPSLSAFKILFAGYAAVLALEVIFSQSGNAGIVNLLYSGAFLFCVIVTMRLRNYVRHKYTIPATTCDGCCEDCCCAFWCLPCTVCHVSRHTADFRNNPAGCCTDNGLYRGAPNVV